jgi:hypothetical protein
MSGDIGSYEKQIWDLKGGFHLNYPPGQRLKLGDIMVRQKGIWLPIGNVGEQLGFTFDKVDEPDSDPWVISSEEGVKVDGEAKAETADALQYLADASAGAVVRFTGADRFLLSMTGVRVTRVSDIDAFWNEIKKRRNLWLWDRKRRIVTTLVEAGSATFLANGEGNKTFVLKAEGSVNTGPVPLADLGAGFSLVSSISTSESFVGRKGVQPLFRLHRVKLLTGPGEAALGDEMVERLALEEDSQTSSGDDKD